jgi:competence protein ComEA
VPEIGRPQLAIYIAAAIAIALVGARYVATAKPVSAAGSGAGGRMAGSRDAPGGSEGPGEQGVRIEAARPSAAVVDVAGAVRRPGVYRLPPGSRVNDAIRRAGGPTTGADISAVNLAAPLEDGRQILVPERPGGVGADASNVGSGGAAAGGATAAGAVGGQPVNLNTATLDELQSLDGIGPGLAGRIVAYRQEHNGFRTVDELAQVPGIGPKRLAALRDRVRA